MVFGVDEFVSSDATIRQNLTYSIVGMEKVVRGVLPEDYQIVIAFGSIEFGLIFLLTRGGDSEAEPAAPVATSDASASADIPSILSDEFEEWSKVPGNLEKWEASLEDM